MAKEDVVAYADVMMANEDVVAYADVMMANEDVVAYSDVRLWLMKMWLLTRMSGCG